MRKLVCAALLAAMVAVCPARANLTTTNSRVQYTSNGVTVAYATTYRFLDSSHLVVSKTVSAVTTVLVLGTDYSVTGANAVAGGTVTLTVAVANGGTVLIARNTPKKPECSLRTQVNYSPKVVEDCIDRLEMQIQEMNDGTITSIVVPPITTAQLTTAAPSEVPNSTNTNVEGSSSAVARADHLHKVAVGPMLGASTAAGQSIPNNTVTIVIYGTVERDTDSAYNAGTGRYTIPTGKGGDYFINGAIAWNAGLVVPATLNLYKNAVAMKVTQAQNPAANQSIAISAILNVAAGDILDLRAFQASGGAVVLSSTATLNYFAIKRIQ